jgi:hypothetical protein
MPVFRPSANLSQQNSLYAYAVVGFAGLRIEQSYWGQQALNQCLGSSGGQGGDPGSARCLVASWQGYTTGGLTFGGNNNYGATIVALTG